MTWKDELHQSIRTVEELLQVVPALSDDREKIAHIMERSPMLVTPYYLSLIDFSDENDPIKKIALPHLAEEDLSGSFDTSGEGDNTVVRGLQHKYAETALLLSTSLCATYCRHCFRKRLVGLPDEDSVQNLDEAASYLRQHHEIKNVLISGGDALVNSNERLAEILEMLAEFNHLDFIRVATRTPVTLPSRITEDPELIDLLAQYSKIKQIYLVTQFDHPREITPEATAAVRAMLDRGIPVRNQTVLLRGVNDRAEVLNELLGSLVAIGAEPYYIFQCRPVSSVKSHFQVPLKEGLQVVEAARGMQSGIGKAFRYCMSHVEGKIEIVGSLPGDEILFKFHEAKDRNKLGKVFAQKVEGSQAWLDTTLLT